MQGTKHSETFYFSSIHHLERFQAALEATNKVWHDDWSKENKIQEEYGAALYVLTSSSGTWERAKAYVLRSNGILFDELLANEHWSGGYVSLIKLAGNLFNAGYTKCDPVDLVTGLDERNFNVAMTALRIRRRAWPLQHIIDHAEFETGEA